MSMTILYYVKFFLQKKFQWPLKKKEWGTYLKDKEQFRILCSSVNCPEGIFCSESKSLFTMDKCFSAESSSFAVTLHKACRKFLSIQGPTSILFSLGHKKSIYQLGRPTVHVRTFSTAQPKLENEKGFHFAWKPEHSFVFWLGYLVSVWTQGLT